MPDETHWHGWPPAKWRWQGLPSAVSAKAQAAALSSPSGAVAHPAATRIATCRRSLPRAAICPVHRATRHRIAARADCRDLPPKKPARWCHWAIPACGGTPARPAVRRAGAPTTGPTRLRSSHRAHRLGFPPPRQCVRQDGRQRAAGRAPCRAPIPRLSAFFLLRARPAPARPSTAIRLATHQAGTGRAAPSSSSRPA